MNNKELIKQIITRMSDEEIKSKDVSRVVEIALDIITDEEIDIYYLDETTPTGNEEVDNSTCLIKFSENIEKEMALYLNQLQLG